MPSTRRRRALTLATAPVALVTYLVLSAAPAGAHNVSGGSLPAPAWLLGYIGAFAVGLTAVALRSAWASPRWASATGDDVTLPLPEGAGTAELEGPGPAIGQVAGAVVYALVTYVALAGPANPGANLAPYAVFVIWWVALPVVCLLAGDVMRAVNPFVAVVALIDRARGAGADIERPVGPAWTGPASYAAFAWFFLAYHRAGSPRMLGLLLVTYAAAAVAGGVRWGPAWLTTGEGFGALSRGVSQISLRRRRPAPSSLLALAVVWIGGTLYDAVSSTEFWVDVQGTSTGWARTSLNTVGLLWMTAVVAAVVLVVLRAVDAPGFGSALGLALLPVALAWFVAHDLTFFLFESQNFYALASDPLGRGWDLFGTISHTVDYSLVTGRWVRWVQLLALLLAHGGAVVLAHDSALVLLGRRRGMRATWVATAALAASILAAAFLVIE